MDRVKKIRELLTEKNLEGVLLYKPENRRYASGFTGSTGYVLITETEAVFMTDFRYTEQASIQCKGYEVVEISHDKPIYNIINQMDIKSLGFEDDFVTYGQYKELSEKLEKTELVPLDGAMTKIRAIKSTEEIQYIEKAASITDETFKHLLDFIKPGMSELDVNLELEYFMKKKGASGVSFSAIVASGKRSSLPHGVASEKIIEVGDLVTIDMGCIYKGYCSDMTRTFVMGKADEKQKEIYSIVLEAQEKALKSVKPGMTGEELDRIARDIIEEKGYGEYFGHGLGHGVGLEVHELPRLSQMGKMPMEAGMIITIEPGIYIPEYGGVRIEDLVLVTENGYKVLSQSTKELIELQI